MRNFSPIKAEYVFGIAIVVLVVMLFANPISHSTPTAKAIKEISDGPVVETERLLVKLSPELKGKMRANSVETGISSLDEIHARHAVKRFEKLSRSGDWYVVTVAQEDKKSLEKEYKKVNEVLAVEPDYPVESYARPAPAPTPLPGVVPNDPLLSQTNFFFYGNNVAWALTTGAPSTVIAVVDTGIDTAHIELRDQLWSNPGETPGDGIDNDNNGFIDDINGWNFVAMSGNILDDNGHGSHVAGIASAQGNNGKGITGMVWQSRILPVKFLNDQGTGFTSDAARAISYATESGAQVIIMAFGSNFYSQAVEDALKDAHQRGVILVAGAGNGNKDVIGFHPASSDKVITAAGNAGFLDPISRWSGSNFGDRIDVSAQAYLVASVLAHGELCPPSMSVSTLLDPTDSNNTYCFMTGTSMSTGAVGGLAALVIARNPSLTNEQVRQVLRHSAHDSGELGWDKYFGYGVINSSKAVHMATSPIPIVSISSPATLTNVTDSVTVIGTAAGDSFASFILEYRYSNTSVWMPISQSTVSSTEGVLGVLDTTSLPAGQIAIRLTVFDTAGKAFWYEVPRINIGTGQNLAQISITAPKNGALVPRTQYLNTTVQVSSVNGVAWVRIYVDGQLAMASNTLPNTFLLAMPAIGPHTMYATVTDSLNQVGTSPIIEFTVTDVDIAPPIVNITYPPLNSKVPRGTTIQIKATASDPSGISKVEFYAGTKLLCSLASAPYECPYRTSSKTGYYQVIRADAYDGVGNKGSIVTAFTTQ